jgi:hypothetical protein
VTDVRRFELTARAGREWPTAFLLTVAALVVGHADMLAAVTLLAIAGRATVRWASARGQLAYADAVLYVRRRRLERVPTADLREARQH